MLPLSLLASQSNQRQLAASVRELLDEQGQEPGKVRGVWRHDATQCDSNILDYIAQVIVDHIRYIRYG